MSSSVRKVPVRYFALVCDALRQQGVDTVALLRMAGIEPERFEQRDSTLLPSEVEGFIASARRLSGRSDIGFEMGRLIKMNSHDLLGFGMISARNFDEVMRLVVRHYHLMTETFQLRYERSPGRGEAIYTPAIPMPLEVLRFYYEVLALAHQNQVQMMLGQVSFDIYLSMPEPPHLRRYDLLAPVRFHFVEHAVPGVRVVMDSELLDRPLPMADPRVLKEVDERCSALAQRPSNDDRSWGEYITMLLRESQGELLTLEDLARRLKVSVRTLDRYLKKEDLNFRDLSQQVRFEQACELLREPGATVAQVALRLGFSDAANFSRAFRRVLGCSPSEYQQRLT
ncbi:AraC family transcriptional regulator [Pelomonas sp. SE-A7]|uniref:helix-turn-helix domain-containing protein n=1 Tax=Pelomonas sp. SE-A7 TaxID=3054953 RepID=UPI00259CD83D|nr:AraC family transcriptional regulator [Pelomonas sp. SE-A7]MDM4765060.1 helix-turn-helix domain-containing protein [Pelomonas sp. SE-A7]